MSVSSVTIKAIFTNLLFVIGVILIIFGFSKGTLTLARIATFEKYPLDSYQETKCELEVDAPRYVKPDGTVENLTAAEKSTKLAKCSSSLEHERSVKKLDDLVISFSTLIAGTAVAFSFKRFIFK